MRGPCPAAQQSRLHDLTGLASTGHIVQGRTRLEARPTRPSNPAAIAKTVSAGASVQGAASTSGPPIRPALGWLPFETPGNCPITARQLFTAPRLLFGWTGANSTYGWMAGWLARTPLLRCTRHVPQLPPSTCLPGLSIHPRYISRVLAPSPARIPCPICTSRAFDLTSSPSSLLLQPAPSGSLPRCFVPSPLTSSPSPFPPEANDSPDSC